ncbi:MAG: HPP family protein [Candidatus Omnitrophica bacterium]|nr:HPP family protein [Candidatus Omnitrophota bacterium]
MITFDPKFRKNKKEYILQSLLAATAAFLVLLLLDVATNAAVIAALGSSAFIAFTMPAGDVSSARKLIGGYLAGIVVGCLCHYLSILPALQNIEFIAKNSYVIFCSLSVGLSVFLMVVTNTEHPPAAGLAMGLFLNKCEVRSVLVVIIGIICLVAIKTLLRPLLKDLL